jgi:AraC-like DNA-binding protein
MPAEEQEITDFRVAEAVRSIKSNYNQELDFISLAETLNLSASRLRHLFKEQTGISFRKYLRQVRMSEARHLLETSFPRLRRRRGVSASAMSVGLSEILKNNSDCLPPHTGNIIVYLKRTDCLYINLNKN